MPRFAHVSDETFLRAPATCDFRLDGYERVTKILGRRPCLDDSGRVIYDHQLGRTYRITSVVWGTDFLPYRNVWGTDFLPYRNLLESLVPRLEAPLRALEIAGSL